MITIQKIITENQESTNVNTTDACFFAPKLSSSAESVFWFRAITFLIGVKFFAVFASKPLFYLGSFLLLCAKRKVCCLPFCFATWRTAFKTIYLIFDFFCCLAPPDQEHHQ